MKKQNRLYLEASSVENDKRRRVLAPLTGLDPSSRLFFDRILSVRKIREFIFISKTRVRGAR